VSLVFSIYSRLSRIAHSARKSAKILNVPVKPWIDARGELVYDVLVAHAVEHRFPCILSYADAGQMHLYLNYAREHWMKPGENPPVGLILCAEKGAAEAHYALDTRPAPSRIRRVGSSRDLVAHHF
jgi:hypothetical protein